jgi:hypothetical protein
LRQRPKACLKLNLNSEHKVNEHADVESLPTYVMRLRVKYVPT